MNVKQLLLAKTGSSSPSAKFDGIATHHEHYPTTANSHSSSSHQSVKESLAGEAELLLSFANIARCEISDHPRALDGIKRNKLRLPLLPSLMESSSPCTIDTTPLAPRTEPILSTFKPLPAPCRLRTVSFDTHADGKHFRSRTPSPSQEHNPSGDIIARKTPMVVSPDNRRPLLHSTRQSKRARRQTKVYRETAGSDSSEEVEEQEENSSVVPIKKRPNGRLQAKPPSGVEVIAIHRRKFSWKNYPELEQFLVTNREEYLRHSALNYTIQQKQYNNRLTERLLEIASEHGYMFSTKDFNFVTVRDRIRCFYKSYVQSAKKRGVLMGYAARKAGLISEDDLFSAGDGEIVTPASCS